MPLPKMTEEQKARGLEAAKRARRVRAQLREDFREGRITIEQVFEKAESDPIVKKTRVDYLLKAVPGYGDARVKNLMEQLRIDPARRVGGLGSQQREKLITAIDDARFPKAE